MGNTSVHCCRICGQAFASLIDGDVHMHQAHGQPPGSTLAPPPAPEPQKVEAHVRKTRKRTAWAWKLAGPITDFWLNVRIGDKDECWPWIAGLGDDGYGSAYLYGRSHGAHRVAWEFSNGNPGKMLVCHTCDNPPCCNPDHLFLGTHVDNDRDSRLKGRSRRSLTAAQVSEIRRCCKPGIPGRHNPLGAYVFAAKFGVGPRAVLMVAKRHTFSWEQDPNETAALSAPAREALRRTKP